MNRSTKLLVLAAGACASIASAQGFNQIIGTDQGDTANGIAHTRDGGWVTVGALRRVEDGETDILVVKYRLDGAVEWARTYGRDQSDIGYSIRQTRDDGYIVGAESESFGESFNLLMMRLDASGGQQWVWAHQGSSSAEDRIHRRNGGVSVREVDGGFCMTGRQNSDRNTQEGQFIYCDDSGNPYYNLGYSDGNDPERSSITFSDVVQNREDAGFYIVGTKLAPARDGSQLFEPTLLRIERSGNPIIAVQYRGWAGEPNGFFSTGDGLSLIEGRDVIFSGRNNQGRPGEQNLHVFRVDSGLGVTWSQIEREAGSGYRSVEADDESRISISGWKGDITNAGASLAHLLRMDGAGNAMVGVNAGLLATANGHVFSPLNPLGGYALAGTLNTDVSSGFVDIELIHADNALDVGCRGEMFEPRLEPISYEPIRWNPRARNYDSFRTELEVRELGMSEQDVCSPPACPTCAADFNQDGGVDGTDVEAFFTTWSAGEACGDVDQNGGVDGADVAAFFTVWSAGGC